MLRGSGIYDPLLEPSVGASWCIMFRVISYLSGWRWCLLRKCAVLLQKSPALRSAADRCIDRPHCCFVFLLQSSLRSCRTGTLSRWDIYTQSPGSAMLKTHIECVLATLFLHNWPEQCHLNGSRVIKIWLLSIPFCSFWVCLNPGKVGWVWLIYQKPGYPPWKGGYPVHYKLPLFKELQLLVASTNLLRFLCFFKDTKLNITKILK